MILAIDAYYFDGNQAKTVGILFDRWQDAVPSDILITYSNHVSEYEPGCFYKRELPCILQLLESVNLSEIEVIIVDGYVFLDETKKGLGYYLYEQLDRKIPVIGVAKTSFHNNNAVKVYRGKSNAPLFVTSIGMKPELAAKYIESMDGEYRIPTLLKKLDQETKNLPY